MGKACTTKMGKSTYSALQSYRLTSFKKIRHTGVNIITSYKYCEEILEDIPELPSTHNAS